MLSPHTEVPGKSLIQITATPKSPDPKARLNSRGCRCSRPLCSSQNTGGTPPAHHPLTGHSVTQDKGPEERPPKPPFGNSEVRSLRTQQRARELLHQTELFLTRTEAQVVLTSERFFLHQSHCSTHERHRRTDACVMATRQIAL